MEISKIRRKPATYGKVNKRFPLHNFFDASPQRSISLDPSTPPPLEGEKASQPTTESHLSQPLDTKQTDAALFDVSSSGEEDAAMESAYTSQKRRKLIAGFHTSASNSVKSDEDVSPKRGSGSDGGEPVRVPAKSTLRAYRRTNPTTKPAPRPIKSQVTTRERGMDQESRQSSSRTTSATQSPELGGSPSRSSRQSDHSAQPPPAATQRTPKHKRINSALSQTGATIMSPGKLGFNSLRLTPERKASQQADESMDAAAYATSPTPRKGRTRLVDRLDGPTSQTRPTHFFAPAATTTKISESTIKHVAAKTPSLVQESSFELPDVMSEQAFSQRPISGQTFAKTKKSYTEQRSFLNEKVSGVDRPKPITSEAALDDLLLPDPRTQDSIKSQLELEDSDSDDLTAGTRMKSIHELRRAGANSRWDREIETIFEDLESGGAGSRSLRLHGLAQILRKLPMTDFLNRLLDAGYMDRLSAVALQNTDVLSCSLEALIFFAVAAEYQAKLEPSPQMRDAVEHLAVLLSDERRSLTKLAKDRNENLSKSTIREVSECERAVRTFHAWQDRELEHVSPQTITVRCLAAVAALLKSQGLRPFPLSGTLFAQIVQILETSVDDETAILGQLHENMTKEIIVLLESVDVLLSNRTDADPYPNSVRSLGKCLCSLLRNMGKEDVGFEQALLRIVVNISNNRSEVCGLLVTTHAHDHMFQIVRDNFLQLATSTDAGDEFDKAKLDSVILALGGLLNFADCSIKARHALIEMGDPPKSNVDWLLQVFNDRVEQASDITTIDQSQVLVAFGYLSMLLCTLCLEEHFRQYARPKLYGQSFDELFVAGKTFFIHLKQIEGIDPDDEAMSAFSNRFGHILISMREMTA